MDKESDLAYWRLVRACLREFFGLDAPEARKAVRGYRRRLLARGRKVYEFAFHDEPLNSAAALAGVCVIHWEGMFSRYDQLLEEAYVNARDQPS